MHICVLGAGIIGVTSAYRLLEGGHQVTLVDAEAQPGAQTSFANGGQLSFSYVQVADAPGRHRSVLHTSVALDPLL